MAEIKGGKLPKSEITTVRLDPKLRYLAELAARKQRRSLSSFIEWAIEDSLSRFPLREGEHGSQTVMGEAEKLWDVDSADRFVKLALHFPELMTHDEQVLWKLVRENGYLWKGHFSKYGDKEWTWAVDQGSIVFHRLRDKWETFKGVAAGELPASSLPSWSRKTPTYPPAPSAGASTDGPIEKAPDSDDDDIPF